MHAIYKIPESLDDTLGKPSQSNFQSAPILRKIEILDLTGERFFFDPKHFTKPNQLDVKKAAGSAKKVDALL